MSNDKTDYGLINCKYWKERKVCVFSNTNGELIMIQYGYGKAPIVEKIRAHMDYIHDFKILNEWQILSCGEDKGVSMTDIRKVEKIL